GHYHARPYQAGYYIREPHRHQHAEVTRDHGGAVAGPTLGRQTVNYVADHADSAQGPHQRTSSCSNTCRRC
ncbi:hypothetical protein AVEN_193951-1, partial [Araneus ventricosus]